MIKGSRINAIMNSYKFVKESGGNDTKWYRLWTDGWIEQGGFNTNTGGSITFLKQMKTTTYTAICVHNGNTAKGEGFVHCYNKSTTGMSYGLSVSTSGMAWSSWYICGQAA